MAMLSTQNKANLEPAKAWQRLVTRIKSNTVATAQEFEIDIPRDHFIHEIIINVYESTVPTTYKSSELVDDLTDIELVANGNKYLKHGTASMFKQVMKINKRKPATGLYELFFTDPKITDAMPLPAWIFTSLVLKLTDNAPAGSNYHIVDVVIVESSYNNENLDNWRVLIEKYVRWAHYLTNTEEQNYEHEKAYKIYGYLYAMDDNATLSNTIFTKISILGRKPEGELTIVDKIPITLLRAENGAEIGVDTLDTGYVFLEWAKGFPANEYSSLYSKPYITTAGTNASLRVLERYTL
jgi:hypothetical protein